ncbi:MAG: acyl-CoA dehydrogenase family protein [Acidimicrobiia bacterium]
MTPVTDAELARWTAEAEGWLDRHCARRPPGGERASYALFHSLDEAAERALVDAAKAWQRTKHAAGYGAIGADPAIGGDGLGPAHRRAFEELEARYATPEVVELVPVSLDLVAPTLGVHGTDEQKARFAAPILRGEILVCQLFSEPGAGSDLAALSCRATRDGNAWTIDGQKVWTSGAHLADHGLLLARTDPVSKHGGLTAFVVPMDAPGVTVRPIRQLTGGTAFNEVFLDGVRVDDDRRVGAVGDGWSVALTTLAFERARSGRGGDPGGGYAEIAATARRTGRTGDPVVRQLVADVYVREVVQRRYARQVALAADAGVVTAEGSIVKLLWLRTLGATATAATALAGPHLVAGTGEDRREAWSEHVLGAPGYRIAGGTDEVQRTIIAERLLGLPREPRPPAGRVG